MSGHGQRRSFGHPEWLLLNRFIDSADDFLIRGIRGLQCGLQWKRQFVHSVSGSRSGNALWSGRNMHTRKLAGVCDMRIKTDCRNPLEVLDGRLRHGGTWVSANNEGSVAVAANKHVDSTEFARVVAGISAIECDAERVSRLPSHDDVRAGDISMASHGHGHKFGKRVELGCQRQQGRAVHVLAAGHRESHTEEHAAKFAVLHLVDEFVEDLTGHPGFFNLSIRDPLIFDHCTEDGNQLKILARPNLQKRISCFSAFRFSDIDQDHRAVLAAAGQKLALLHDGVLREVPGMTLRWVTTPIDDEICSLFYFTQRTSDFTTQLGGDFSRTVSQRGVAVQQPSQLVRQSGTLFLGLTRRITHPVYQRHVSFVQVMSGRLDGLIQCGLFPVDQSNWILLFGGMVEEPCGAKDAGLLGFVNPNFIVVKLNVVTDAATKRTCGVINNLKSHLKCSFKGTIPCFLSGQRFAAGSLPGQQEQMQNRSFIWLSDEAAGVIPRMRLLAAFAV